MGLTKNKINYHYNKAIKYADELNSIADKLEKNAKDEFEKSLGELNSIWKGDNANTYISEGKKLCSNMNTTIGNIRSLSSSIKKEAKSIRAVELSSLNK